MAKDQIRDLWINPRRNMRGIDGNRAWDNQGNISSSTGARFLELADIALGTKKVDLKKKREAARVHPISSKPKTYSR